ncbi:MAG TPA: DMT family transporter [Candidatus Anaerobutyricum stercoripullorum]|uniref:DMT family transporter n=1 Tax=Candidatus Anaerobutyricum stercoripullorum TaxID=2838456 RepID=A0A9D2BDY3_9FIRM|nr:DMT family transporter [Candidatus Anaerobutyricum stercoripullorum]
METPKKTHKVRNTFFLILTALIWGAAFVAQSVSMDYIEPLTFIFLRSLIGGLFLIPCIWMLDWLNRRSEDSGQEAADSREGLAAREAAAGERKGNVRWWTDRQVLTGGIVCGLFLFFANCFQQTGIQYTTVGKAGFITSFYIIIVPLLGIFLKRYCGILTWVAVVIALAGLYFLCMNEALEIQTGDFLILISAFLFAGQILAIDHFVRFVDGVKMSCIQFLTGAVLGCVGMLLFESPQISLIVQAAVPVLYTGIMSTGVGYTLQIVGQKGMNPTMAALILSLESVFSALSGFVILHQVMSGRELLGCVLMFTAIILAQLPDFRKKL